MTQVGGNTVPYGGHMNLGTSGGGWQNSDMNRYSDEGGWSVHPVPDHRGGSAWYGQQQQPGPHHASVPSRGHHPGSHQPAGSRDLQDIRYTAGHWADAAYQGTQKHPKVNAEPSIPQKSRKNDAYAPAGRIDVRPGDYPEYVSNKQIHRDEYSGWKNQGQGVGVGTEGFGNNKWKEPNGNVQPNLPPKQKVKHPGEVEPHQWGASSRYGEQPSQFGDERVRSSGREREKRVQELNRNKDYDVPKGGAMWDFDPVRNEYVQKSSPFQPIAWPGEEGYVSGESRQSVEPLPPKTRVKTAHDPHRNTANLLAHEFRKSLRDKQKPEPLDLGQRTDPQSSRYNLSKDDKDVAYRYNENRYSGGSNQRSPSSPQRADQIHNGLLMQYPYPEGARHNDDFRVPTNAKQPQYDVVGGKNIRKREDVPPPYEKPFERQFREPTRYNENFPQHSAKPPVEQNNGTVVHAEGKPPPVPPKSGARKSGRGQSLWMDDEFVEPFPSKSHSSQHKTPIVNVVPPINSTRRMEDEWQRPDQHRNQWDPHPRQIDDEWQRPDQNRNRQDPNLRQMEDEWQRPDQRRNQLEPHRSAFSGYNPSNRLDTGDETFSQGLHQGLHLQPLTDDMLAGPNHHGNQDSSSPGGHWGNQEDPGGQWGQQEPSPTGNWRQLDTRNDPYSANDPDYNEQQPQDDERIETGGTGEFLVISPIKAQELREDGLTEEQIKKYDEQEKSRIHQRLSMYRLGETAEVGPFNIVIFGKTRSGKSSTANSLLGEDRFAVGNTTGQQHELRINLTSVTRHYQWAPCLIRGREYRIIDTPDLLLTGDLSMTQKLMEEQAIRILEACHGIVHAFVYILNPNDHPKPNEQELGLTKLEKLFGPCCSRHSIMLMTHADVKFNQQNISNYIAIQHNTFLTFVGKYLHECVMGINNRAEYEYEREQSREMFADMVNMLQRWRYGPYMAETKFMKKRQKKYKRRPQTNTQTYNGHAQRQ